jgi:Protein of unknown function (DUF3187)
MARSYGAPASVVKRYLALVPRLRATVYPLTALCLVFLIRSGCAQGLPAFSPANPMSSSRSGLYFQPYRDPRPGRWTAEVTLDYASMVEYNLFTTANYVLDSEVMRGSFQLGRDLSCNTFAMLDLSVGGAYAGFMDGFLDWYHRLLGIRVSERQKRPRNRFLYLVQPASGTAIQRSPHNFFLNDSRLTLGLRYSRLVQSVLSVTLPTSTAPDGYGRGVPSFGLLNTVRAPVGQTLLYEGSLGVGMTPRHGELSAYQKDVFATLSSGLRIRLWGRQSIFGNVFYHSPYYHDTTLPALDRRELSFDFGWILGGQRGSEWRLGLTEDLEPGGPGVDLIFRLGRRF